MLDKNNYFKKYENLYEGRHKEVFTFKNNDEKSDYEVLNYPKLAIDFLTNIATSTSPVVLTAEENMEFINKILFNYIYPNFDSDFSTLLSLGNLVVKVGLIEGEPFIDFIHPDRYEKRYGLNGVDIEEQTITHVFMLKNEKYRKVEIDKRNLFIERIEKFNAEKGNWEEVSVNEIKHNCVFLVKHICINKKLGEDWGRSILDGFENVFHNLNNRYGQVGSALNKHNRPIALVSRGIYDEMQKDAEEGYKSDVYMAKSQEEFIKYVQFDSNSQMALAHMEKSLEFLSSALCIPLQVLKGESIQAESGIAYLLKMSPSLMKVKTYLNIFVNAIQSALYTAQKLYIEKGNGEEIKEASKVFLQYKQLLIDDTDVKSEIQKFTEGVQSKYQTVKNLNKGLTEKEIEEELERIKNDAKENFESLTFSEEVLEEE